MDEHIAKGCVSKNNYWIILQKFTVTKNVYLKHVLKDITKIHCYSNAKLGRKK